jgi:hypothetical protein
LRRFYDCFEDFLDDHKEHAFSASFMEPARCYLATGGFAHWLADNVDTHSNNWHIALLNAALGVHVPLLGNYWDDFPPPVVDFWAGLKPQAWDFFRDPAHFGNGWRGIPGLQKQSKKLVARKVETGRLPISAGGMGKRGSCLGQSLDVRVRQASQECLDKWLGGLTLSCACAQEGMKPAKNWANACVNPSEEQAKLRAGVAV